MFVCNIGVKDKLLGVIIQCVYHMLDFIAMNPFYVDDSPDLYDELTGSFKSRFLLLM